MLDQAGHTEAALASPSLLKDVVNVKRAFYAMSGVNYEDCALGEIRLCFPELREKLLRADFVQMEKSGMFDDEVPSFRNIIAALEKLEHRLNRALKAGFGG